MWYYIPFNFMCRTRAGQGARTTEERKRVEEEEGARR